MKPFFMASTKIRKNFYSWFSRPYFVPQGLAMNMDKVIPPNTDTKKSTSDSTTSPAYSHKHRYSSDESSQTVSQDYPFVNDRKQKNSGKNKDSFSIFSKPPISEKSKEYISKSSSRKSLSNNVVMVNNPKVGNHSPIKTAEVHYCKGINNNYQILIPFANLDDLRMTSLIGGNIEDLTSQLSLRKTIINSEPELEPQKRPKILELEPQKRHKSSSTTANGKTPPYPKTPAEPLFEKLPSKPLYKLPSQNHTSLDLKTRDHPSKSGVVITPYSSPPPPVKISTGSGIPIITETTEEPQSTFLNVAIQKHIELQGFIGYEINGEEYFLSELRPLLELTVPKGSFWKRKDKIWKSMNITLAEALTCKLSLYIPK